MEGKREQQSPDQGKRKLPMMMGGAAAVLLAGYIGLCAWVGAQDQVMPNVSVSGMDLSGMTAEEVTLTVDSAESNLAGDVSVKLVCGSWSGVLTGSQLNIETNIFGPSAVAAGRQHGAVSEPSDGTAGAARSGRPAGADAPGSGLRYHPGQL